MNLNLRHLEAFAAVARLHSFTKAARALHVSQPSFTVQIKQLEEELGVRLLDRNTRSVHLTKIGQELAPVVEGLLRELGRDCREYASVVGGEHRVSDHCRASISVGDAASACHCEIS